MKISFKSATVGFAVGLAVAAAGAQAAVQATQHEHQTNSPAAQQAPAGKMKDMHAMMADPAMREKMMAQMGQCRDMMSKMMEHMKHMDHGGQMDKNRPAQPKP
jgi:hypothetical protein